MDSLTNIQRKERLSNIELLRIIAMLMIMVSHMCDSIGAPNKNDYLSQPYFSFVRSCVEYVSVIGVNVFVLISGWFGIRFKWQRLLELYFQIFFFSFLLLIFGLVVNDNNISFGGIIGMLTMGNNDYWFLKVYVMLYIISPILNSFIDNASEKNFRITLVLMALFIFYYGWVSPDSTKWLVKGYCLVWFCFLYLLSRYLRLYKTCFSQFSAKTDFFLYLVFAVILIIVAVFEIILQIDFKGRWKFYLNPFVLFTALFLLLFFSKIKFTNILINRIAVSSVAAFLLHANQNFYTAHYKRIIQNWFDSTPPVLFLIKSVSFIIFLFAISVALDKIRFLIWKKIIGRRV